MLFRLRGFTREFGSVRSVSGHGYMGIVRLVVRTLADGVSSVMDVRSVCTAESKRVHKAGVGQGYEGSGVGMRLFHRVGMSLFPRLYEWFWDQWYGRCEKEVQV